MGASASSNMLESSVDTTSGDAEPWRIPREEHDEVCECEKPAVERTSWTDINPARRFWNCKNSPRKTGPKCGWFLWKDEEMEDGYYKKKLYEMRKDMEKKDKQLAKLTKEVKAGNRVALLKLNEELKMVVGEKNKDIWKVKVKCYFLMVVVAVFVLKMCMG